MAENEPTTPITLPVRPRPLAIPYVLTPAELDGLLRIGENLANISERLTAMMGRNGGPLAGEMRAFVEEVLVTLDRLDGDPDLEPDADGELTANERHGTGFTAASGLPDDAEDNGDGEPSLGAPACDARLIACGDEPRNDRTSSQTRWGAGPRHDLEEEHDGREPSLCGLGFGDGDDGDREGDPAEREHEADLEEGWHQPVRLDVALGREEARHG